MPDPKSTAKDWDNVRSAFGMSIMVDTSLNSLAQNLDGPEWPIKAKDETPSTYIDLPYEEAKRLLVRKGQSADLLDRLIDILKETLAFDDPFGEMVEQAAAAEVRDNPFLKNLGKLGIPEALPIDLTTLSADTLEFCKAEKLPTIGEFAVFAEKMSKTVIVGGDFRRLLNALATMDEALLSEMLPFRKGAKGVHLPEALVQAARSTHAKERFAVAVEWFQDDVKRIRADVVAGGTVKKYLSVLGDEQKEELASVILAPYVGTRGFVVQAPAKKKSFFGRLFGR